MQTHQPKSRLLGLSGSLRTASFCTAILKTFAERIEDRAELDIADLRPIPLYDQDGESEPPPAVRALRQRLAESDGVILVSPEYNHGMPGVLKNTLDWLSRPAYNSPFKSKPCLTATASPAFTGGVRAHGEMLTVLNAMLAHVIPTPQIVIPAVHEKVTEGRLIHAATLDFAATALDMLLAEIARRCAAS